MFRALFLTLGSTIILCLSIVIGLPGNNFLSSYGDMPVFLTLVATGVAFLIFGLLLPTKNSDAGAPIDGEYHIVHRHQYSMLWNIAKIVAILGAIAGIIKLL